MQIAGSKCNVCGKTITLAFDAFLCPKCEVAFHNECVEDGSSCPRCSGKTDGRSKALEAMNSWDSPSNRSAKASSASVRKDSSGSTGPTYKVTPFVAVIDRERGAEQAAKQLQSVIQAEAADGWEYVRLESVETVIKGDNGCLGIGSTPPETTIYSMVVYKR